MATINSYLNFPGTAEEAFNFYKSVFGGEFSVFQRFKDTAEVAEKISAEDGEKIMHVSLPIGPNNILMASDVVEALGYTYKQGNDFHLSIDAGSKEEADKLFAGLSAGGEVTMPLQDTFWGAYFGMWKDKFGISWMMNYDYKEQQ